jgi:hypothetical protein
VWPSALDWESRICFTVWSRGHTQLASCELKGALVWLESRRLGDDVTEYVHAPPDIVDRWYSELWESEASPARALMTLNSMLRFAGCYGRDYVGWLAKNIGTGSLVELAATGAPIEVHEIDCWEYAGASLAFRVPLRVILCAKRVSLWSLECERDAVVGYGHPRRSGEDWDCWIPIGSEETAEWPDKHALLSDVALNKPEYVDMLAPWLPS